ncbi:DMP19 family protein [Pseudomonas sp. CNPSo 3701]|uniref:DMP19 family protein n=1 Tax=Pseudomonas sp. CNPSo 3701 TaxID=3027943 RepID=UPI002363E13C|nr:DMP19 family protein [Pseudomonas sp. CNPSo 3701]MDD1508909.1 DMP19 family protein [Pseudomonas sp. CNPSo 3701]
MSEKLPCKTCGALILPTTALRTDGLCMPCKQGNRESLEKSKERSRQQRAYDPQRAHWHHLVDRAHASEQAFASFTPEEKLYYAVSVLEGEVYNGGVHQFFSNSSGALYEETVEGLKELGATQALALLQRAAQVLFGSNQPPVDRHERWQAMPFYPEDEVATPPAWSIELEEIDRAYWMDPDGLSEKLEAYLKNTGLLKPFEKPAS